MAYLQSPVEILADHSECLLHNRNWFADESQRKIKWRFPGSTHFSSISICCNFKCFFFCRPTADSCGLALIRLRDWATQYAVAVLRTSPEILLNFLWSCTINNWYFCILMQIHESNQFEKVIFCQLEQEHLTSKLAIYMKYALLWGWLRHLYRKYYNSINTNVFLILVLTYIKQHLSTSKVKNLVYTKIPRICHHWHNMCAKLVPVLLYKTGHSYLLLR